MHKVINVKDLQPGMLVSKVISQHGPVKIRKIGMIRSPEMIKGLTEMGVTEVEVDLSQSFGLQDADEAEISIEPLEKEAKLTPTQQLLQNERQSARTSNDTSKQYNRSLFMPSMDSLPSSWDLYGKNIALLLLLVIGGVCVGWNIASIPKWLSLSKSKDYVVIDYQPAYSARKREELTVGENSSKNTDGPNNLASTEQEKNAKGSTEKVSPGKETSKQNPQAVDSANNFTSEQANQPSKEEVEPLVLGYQPKDEAQQEALDRVVESQSETISNEAEETQTDARISAALLNKINKAIADLDNDTNLDSGNQQATNYDDLPRIDQLSIAIQTQLPSMAFSAHMYSSDRDGRWVRVNGRRLVEGDFIAEGLQLVNIEPQKVILSFKDEIFTMNALSDW
ncbi:general secretion pathway protein GspB [Brumicola nitratireducens]|uniref:General secretion pathway protein B n=1 Tax=Glaciecola nitratireducens (strain JCM 12485 / KCTC 12276 / FR1064) TaxID=1085623 RepID=G4QJZ6_GLANF|nr:general secretion pathway protein GspB [Glaciecola nitratireducens]AEP29118.1 general secretion pathway protein B [Glaciecola nitratireducens FR1064]